MPHPKAALPRVGSSLADALQQRNECVRVDEKKTHTHAHTRTQQLRERNLNLNLICDALKSRQSISISVQFIVQTSRARRQHEAPLSSLGSHPFKRSANSQRRDPQWKSDLDRAPVAGNLRSRDGGASRCLRRGALLCALNQP